MRPAILKLTAVYLAAQASMDLFYMLAAFDADNRSSAAWCALASIGCLIMAYAAWQASKYRRTWRSGSY